MGRSFYFGTIAQLYTGTQTFSDLIVASPTSFGLTAPQAASYKTLSDDYVAKYQLSEAPETRTKGTVQARNDAKVLLKQKQRSWPRLSRLPLPLRTNSGLISA